MRAAQPLFFFPCGGGSAARAIGAVSVPPDGVTAVHLDAAGFRVTFMHVCSCYNVAMTTYGYARCSTDERRQDVNRQKRDLLAMGVDDETKIYWEYESGTGKKRPEFQKLLNVLAPGDAIAVTEVSRLTRSTQQLCEVLQLVQDKRLCLRIGTFTVDCRDERPDAMTKGMLLMWGVFSEMEREMLSERVKSGMANARAMGKTIGHPRLRMSDIPQKFWKHYPSLKEKKLSLTDLAKIVGVSRPTIYRYIALAEGRR